MAEAVLLRTPGIAVLGDWFQLRLVYNQGAAFGLHLGPYSRWIFLTVAIVAVVVLRRMSRTSPPGDWFRQLALGLVAGGAAGNLIDRIRSTRGVVDFLDVGIGALRWPTFNVADIAVSCGAIALVVSMWREDVRQPEPPAAGRDTTRSEPGGLARSHLLRPRGRHRAARPLSRRPVGSLPHPGRPAGGRESRAGRWPARPRQPHPRPGRRESSPRRSAAGPGAPAGPDPLTIVFEDEHLAVLDKPAGLVVHPAPGHWDDTLVNALVARGTDPVGGAAGRPGIVHRLDRDTSGLMVVAKTDLAHRRLGAAIAARRVRRTYAALAWGHLDASPTVIDAPLARHPRDRKRMAVLPDGRAARTDAYMVARFGRVDLLRLELHTGRTHQIRVHLEHVGPPGCG